MRKLASCVLALAAVAAVPVSFASELAPEHMHFRPTGKGNPEHDPNPGTGVHNEAAKGFSANGIVYHGGPVMTNALGVNVYYIWYGNWSAYGNAQTILRNFMKNLGGSPLFNTNTSYSDLANLKVVNRVALSTTEYTNSYLDGTSLSDNGVKNAVARAIGTGGDVNGLYFVLTSPDVHETSGFGSQYCGWHTSSTINGKAIKYSFVGNPITIAPAGCGVRSPSPNGDGGADAMASVMFHELSETVTDPQLNAWYDTRGYENADKCAWTYGTTYKSPNGAVANVQLGGAYYLVQRNWVNASGGYCSMLY